MAVAYQVVVAYLVEEAYPVPSCGHQVSATASPGVMPASALYEIGPQ